MKNIKKLTNRQRVYAEKLLECIAAKRESITYGELAGIFGVSPQTVGRDIGEISKVCHELGLPLISGMVINKSTLYPDPEGFGGLCFELGVYREFRNNYEGLVKQCFEDIHSCDKWYILADYIGSKIEGISPARNTADD